METVTLGQIGLAITFLVGLTTGLAVLVKSLKKTLKTALKDDFDSLSKKIDTMQERIDDVDLASCKNYLVRFLADLDKGRDIDEVETERFWEQLQHYEKIGGNSYIHRKVEQLKIEGKL